MIRNGIGARACKKKKWRSRRNSKNKMVEKRLMNWWKLLDVKGRKER